MSQNSVVRNLSKCILWQFSTFFGDSKQSKKKKVNQLTSSIYVLFLYRFESLSLCFIRPCFFALTVLHFAFLSLLYDTHNTNIHASGETFFCSLSILLYPDCPGFLHFVLTVQYTHKYAVTQLVFQSLNPSGRTVTLGSTQTLTETSTRIHSWG
jgi:hypothetical protein